MKRGKTFSLSTLGVLVGCRRSFGQKKERDEWILIKYDRRKKQLALIGFFQYFAFITCKIH